MGNSFFWWAGVVFCIGVGLVMLVLWLETLWAVFACASWLRFAWAAARARGMPVFPAILKLPGTLCMRWFDFLGYRKGSMVFREKNGVWNGVGDWTVYPPVTQPDTPVNTDPVDATTA
ncbi:hypothetical protein AB4Y45_35490 [Paraburkholderia sp. EG287A]|uniref:hypothetical protein n=1 Tax=Paraburkholderia sp. EG287A TaxID=3237012 RepID=UPI0034D30999